MNRERLKVAGGICLGLGVAATALALYKRYESQLEVEETPHLHPRIAVSALELTYYDEKGRLTTRESDERFEHVHQHLDYDHWENDWALYHRTIEKSEEFLTQEKVARKFWSDLGFSNMPEVYLVEDEPEGEDYLGFKKLPTKIAHYDDTFHHIIVRNERLKELERNEHGQQTVETLVHEFAHATGPKKSLSAVVRKDAEYPWYFGRSGFSLNVKNEFQGSFYEEGFAVFITSCFMRRLQGDNRPIGISGVPTPELPPHFQPPDPHMIGGCDGYAMELLAYGCEQRGIMTAEEFSQMLLATRRDESRAEALRVFARAVEQIRPGLYTQLRRIDYDKEKWREALGWVYDAAVGE